MSLKGGHRKTKRKKAIGIIRVSSKNQARNTAGLETQKNWMRDIGKKQGLEFVKIIKEVISGNVFPEKYFDDILQTAEDEEVDVVVFYSLDRFARNFAAGAQLLKELYRKRGVKIITSLGALNWGKPKDKFMIGSFLLFAEMDKENTKDKCLNGIVTKLKNGIWFLNPPFGCEKDEGKLRLNSNYRPIIKFIFDTFLKVKEYEETARRANEQYGEKMGIELTGGKIKKILKDKTYLGYLRWGGTLYGEGEENKPIEGLRAVEQATFNKAQQIIKRKDRVYSREDNGVIEELVEEYDLESVAEVFSLKPSCEECGSHNTHKNGKEETSGMLQLKFICADCGHHFRIPTKRKIKRIQDLVSLSCKKCGSKNKFTLEKDGDFWKLICENCGEGRLLTEYCDRGKNSSKENNLNGVTHNSIDGQESTPRKKLRENDSNGNSDTSQDANTTLDSF